MFLTIVLVCLFVLQITGIFSKRPWFQIASLVFAAFIINVLINDDYFRHGALLKAVIIGLYMTPTFFYFWSSALLLKRKEDGVESDELAIAHSVFQNTSEAILVCDDKNKIIAVNPAFTKITGYHPIDVIGKKPDILKSGRHQENFYAEMWHSIKTHGKWEGEIWNKRKNGEEYVEWLTINAISDTQGKVRRRIAVFLDISTKKKVEEITWSQANYDPLTNLPNRRYFERQLENTIISATQNHYTFAVLFIDLDGFKKINDHLGHSAGDKVLIEVAKRLQKTVRTSDTVARLGGDEYTIIISQLSEKTDAGRISENILSQLKNPILLDSEEVSISASVGISLFPEDSTTSSGILKCADFAMYEAKNNGKNNFNYYS